MTPPSSRAREIVARIEGITFASSQDYRVTVAEIIANALAEARNEAVKEDAAKEATIRRLADALVLALPYVETALEDKGYKPGAIDEMCKTIRAALKEAGL